MSNNQTVQEKEQKRARAMVIDLVGMLEQCQKVTENISYWDDYDNYQKTYMAELDKQVKARLFEVDERSWSANDIHVFLWSLSNELEKIDRDMECMWNVIRKYNKNNSCISEDFRECPFGVLYQAFLEIVYINIITLFAVRRRFLKEEAKAVV